MWRALHATSGEVVCFLDGDTIDPDPRHLQGLLGPLLTDPSVALVKGAFDRPLRVGEAEFAHEGGRVTELMARPLINLHEPRLAGFSQPLAGEFAARRELLEAIPFPAGYGVEIGILIDALRASGLDGLAECHLGTRHNRHQPLRALGEMAYAVLAAVENRLELSAGMAAAATSVPGTTTRSPRSPSRNARRSVHWSGRASWPGRPAIRTPAGPACGEAASARSRRRCSGAAPGSGPAAAAGCRRSAAPRAPRARRRCRARSRRSTSRSRSAISTWPRGLWRCDAIARRDNWSRSALVAALMTASCICMFRPPWVFCFVVWLWVRLRRTGGSRRPRRPRARSRPGRRPPTPVSRGRARRAARGASPRRAARRPGRRETPRPLGRPARTR